MDKYYTKPEVARFCCKMFKNCVKVHHTRDLIIEPSAGDGSFVAPIKEMCNNTLFIDIAPDNNLIKKTDFLQFKVPSRQKYRKIYVIGNPPFGFKSSMAIKFIKKSCTFCDAFGFILPKSFAKASMRRSVPLHFHLKYQKVLSPDAFLTPRGIPCVFQIWVKKAYNRKTTKRVKPIGYKFVTASSKPDFAIRRVGSKAGQVYSTANRNFNTNTHYFIKLDHHRHKHITYIPSTSKYLVIGPLSLSKQVITKYLNTHLKK